MDCQRGGIGRDLRRRYKKHGLSEDPLPYAIQSLLAGKRPSVSLVIAVHLRLIKCCSRCIGG